MPRQPRAISESGFYHVVLKGDGGQVIFWDDSDRRLFLGLLKERVVDQGIIVLAWCLMSNHVHLLIETTDVAYGKTLGIFMSIYAQVINRRANSCGHLFQGRFYSSQVEDDAHLLDAVRYIHDNPQNAGMCRTENYHWSSYHEYLGRPHLASTGLVLDMLGGLEGFLAFSKGEANPVYWFEGSSRVTDEEALPLAGRIASAHGTTVASVRYESRGVIEATVYDLLRAGLPVSQISRLTGIGRGRISSMRK